MTRYGKGNFGSGIEINAQVVNGQCPFCHTDGILVSIYKTVFRCITCGGDVEQKVNGKIAYIPIGGKIVMAETKDLNNG
jgi:ssDNA-binding Zn-finger/Zn-ribbon topoisomerase 1|tara:strand:+ start:164 stop:400 length:237 start_codon:yes stop_codon:yes gene_type:complete